MLFDGSVRDNIAMNAPDATDEEVIHAARVACAAFVMDLPQGYGSSVGERGAALSGGQRQSAIARAILSRPRMSWTRPPVLWTTLQSVPFVKIYVGNFLETLSFLSPTDLQLSAL